MNNMKILMKSCVLMILMVFSSASSISHMPSDDFIVKTKSGSIRGTLLEANSGKLVEAYLGIPFAEPPVGDLRFKHPKKKTPWGGILDTAKKPNSCVQTVDNYFGEDFLGSMLWNPNTNMSEDCLYLNVYVPKRNETSGNLPVMIWIFGGGFYSGSSTLDIYDGRYLASEGNVIIVSMNYRVGSLGFIYVDGAKENAPGNSGMFDQAMAIQWVHDNIEAFNGIKSEITIFGESAGAASCHLHTLSPITKDLFKNVILQSSTALSPWVISSRNTLNRRARNLAERFKCINSTNDQISIECLRKVDALLFPDADYSSDTFGVAEFPFTPIVDEHFLMDDPMNIMETEAYEAKNIMAGSNSEEGFYFLIYYLPKILKLQNDLEVNRTQFFHSVDSIFPNLNYFQKEAIKQFYTDWNKVNDTSVNRDMIDRIVGDERFHCSVINTVDMLTKMRDVYLYRYTHRYSSHFYPKWMGVLHGDEIFIAFGVPFMKKFNSTEEEKKFSLRMMKYWTNFAKYGNPNGESPREWIETTQKARRYLELNVNGTMKEGFPRANQCALWSNFLPKLSGISKDGQDNAAKRKNSSSSHYGNCNGLLFIISLLTYMVFFS